MSIQNTTILTTEYRASVLNDQIARLELANRRLAEASGITESTIHRIRNGQKVDLAVLVELCQFLKIPVDKVLEPSMTRKLATMIGG